MSHQSVARAHQKMQELAWEPMYHEPVAQYGTDYTNEMTPEERAAFHAKYIRGGLTARFPVDV